MPTDYEQICKDNIRRRGEEFDDIGHLISEQLYSDRSHFVYELIQNAEDALERRFRTNPNDKVPRKVQFRLFRDRLEFRHFGVPFNEEDVKGISDVLKGTKKGDALQIGKFGIGFKSVYAFTTSPEIHSGEEHFIIKRYIRPEAKRNTFTIEENETVFNFPFDHEKLSQEEAFDLILAKLQGLGPSVLLFLRWIDEIEWFVEPAGEKGHYLKEAKQIENANNARRITVIGQNNGKDEEENWLIFERPVTAPGNSDTVRVEVGFRLEAEDKAGKNPERIVKVKDSDLVVYFPTEKATKFGFLIQGPYRTTPSRDNIPKDDDWNKTLVKETAELIRDTLTKIKDLGLFSVSFLEALPIRTEDFPNDSMFYPIVESVRNTLLKEALLPADDGSFVSAGNAKLASADWLRKLLRGEQLKLLYQKEVKWVHGDITDKGRHELWKYFREVLKIDELTPDSFARKLDSAFLNKQSDQWMINFYAQLPNQKALWKKGSYRWDDGPLRKKPFIRLQDGSHVRPFDDDDKPSAYLPAKTPVDSQLPTVKADIANRDEIRQFFISELKIPEFDIVAEVIEHVLPKYKSPNPPQTDEHLRDIEKIVEAFQTDSHEKQKRLKDALKETPFILSRSFGSASEIYRSPDVLYFQDNSLETYFLGNSDVGFIGLIYKDKGAALKMFASLGVRNEVRVDKRKPDYQDCIRLRDDHGVHERGLLGFDPDIKVEGLSFALSSPTTEKSIFIWNKIVLPNAECIRGTIEKSSRQTYEKSSKEERISESFGRLLIENKWLPGTDGQFHCPTELSNNELPEQFERNEKLADFLGMRKSEKVKAADILSEGNPRKKELLERIANASDDELERFEKFVPRTIQPPPAPTFKEGIANMIRPQHGNPSPKIENSKGGQGHPVRNPERYQNILDDAVTDGVEEHSTISHTVQFSPVRDKPDNKEAREFLYIEYHGQCQIKGTTFPKAAANSEGVPENYFEACSLLPYSNAGYLNDAGNMLCVSADTMAKLKYASFEWLDDIKDKVAEFEDGGEKAQRIEIKIKLAGEECVITWSQRHFMRLIALYKQA